MSLNKLLVGIVTVCACAGVSSAAGNSVKVKHFDPAGLGWLDNAQADGMAMVKYDSAISGSRVHLHMQQLLPNRTYGLALQASNSFVINYSNPTAFRTNPGGTISCDIAVPNVDLGATPLFYVYEWDGDNTPEAVDEVSTTEVRAIGMVGEATTETVKLENVTATGDGLTANPNVDGMVVVSYNTLFSGSDVYLRVDGLAPNTTYGVALQATTSSTPEDYANPLAFTTDASGRGTFVTTLPTVDLGTNPEVYIFMWDGDTDPDSYPVITSTESRAMVN